MGPAADAEERSPSILVVDDDADLRRLLVRALSGPGARHVEEAAGVEEARARLGERPFDVVVTDLSMPGEGGLALIEWAERQRLGPSWIVLTGHGTFDAAVKALQLGAFDFLTKPLRGVEKLQNAVRNALAHQQLLAERERLTRELAASNARLREHVEQLEEACQLLEEQADTIRADLVRAAWIQQALLPRAAPKLPGWSVQALYRPSRNVGGDLYDVVRLDEHRLVLLVADAAGHGVSAAMLAVLFRNRLPLLDPDGHDALRPGEALQVANRALSSTLAAPGLFLTAACCLVDLERREVCVASAGHPPILVVRREGRIERLLPTGPALGLYPDAVFGQQETVLEKGDRLLLYTDGVYEAFADAAVPEEQMLAAVQRERGPGAELLQRLAGEAEPGALPPRDDDLTLLLLDTLPGASHLDNALPEPLSAPTRAASGPEFTILVGQDARRTTLSLRGRAGWARSASFHHACLSALEAGRSVKVDLTGCRHLDSTFLGTIHELCDRAERAGVEFRLEGVSRVLEELFVELGMRRVLEHVVPFLLPLPSGMRPLSDAADRERSPAERILHAHEVLAALSERNRREFDPLLASLRRELGGPSSCST